MIARDREGALLRRPVAMSDAARRLAERGCTPEIIRATMLAWAEESARVAIEWAEREDAKMAQQIEDEEAAAISRVDEGAR